jgi:nucleoside-diphosphate-sugar epimerase
MKRVLVTGATGFVGQVLCEVLARSGYSPRAVLHRNRLARPLVPDCVVIDDISHTTDWTAALTGVDYVVHLAARAHVLHEQGVNSNLYFETNTLGTNRLVNFAAAAGIRRFVYLSSVKVNGEETYGTPYTPNDEPSPRDPYGTSKWLGEKSVLEVATRTGLEVTIVRSPLVYGHGVRANFLRLLQWVDRELPLPFGAIHNQRSLVNIWNLCDLLVKLLENPAAVGRTWLVSDGEDVSTPELIRRIGFAMDRRVRLVPIHNKILRLCGALTGRRAEANRLCGSLTVDISDTKRQLRWMPSISVDEGLMRTARWYLSEFGTRG